MMIGAQTGRFFRSCGRIFRILLFSAVVRTFAFRVDKTSEHMWCQYVTLVSQELLAALARILHMWRAR